MEDSDYYTDNGNVSQPGTVNSRIASLFGADYEKISSQQALTRTLPPSLQPSAPISKLNSLAGNKGSSQVRDTYDSTYHSAGPSATSSKGYLRDQFNRSKNDEVIMYENSGNRILPPSLMHGKATFSNQFAGSSDPSYRSMAGEERPAENDERLIYQAALEVLLAVNCYHVIQFELGLYLFLFLTFECKFKLLYKLIFNSVRRCFNSLKSISLRLKIIIR